MISDKGDSLEEVSYKDDQEFSTFYNFKTGKVIFSNVDGVDQLFTENILQSKDYKISVSLSLNHGILPYCCAYPIGSSFYKAPTISNYVEVKKFIIENIDSFLNFKSTYLRKNNYINLSIPFENYKGNLSKEIKMIKNIIKIEEGSYENKN